MTDSVLINNLLAYAFQIALLVIVGVWLPRALGLRAPRVTLGLYQGLLLACLMLPLLATLDTIDYAATANCCRNAFHGRTASYTPRPTGDDRAKSDGSSRHRGGNILD